MSLWAGTVEEPKQHFITDQMLRARPRPVDLLDRLPFLPLLAICRLLRAVDVYVKLLRCNASSKVNTSSSSSSPALDRMRNVGGRRAQGGRDGIPKCASDILESVESRKSGSGRKWGANYKSSQAHAFRSEFSRMYLNRQSKHLDAKQWRRCN